MFDLTVSLKLFYCYMYVSKSPVDDSKQVTAFCPDATQGSN